MVRTILFFLSLFFAIYAQACPEVEKALIIGPQESVRLIVDPRQEVIFDGGLINLKILSIESVTTKDRPRLNIMTGLQVLENGEMKSYPHRISVTLPVEERGTTPRTIQIHLRDEKKKVIKIFLEYLAFDPQKCPKPEVKKI